MFTHSDIQFSELVAQCKILLSKSKFDEVFLLLSEYEIPKQGNLVLSKALWLRLKMDKMHGTIADVELKKRTEAVYNSLIEALSNLQEVYLNTTENYIETSFGFEKILPSTNKTNKRSTIKKRKTLHAFLDKKIISLDEFIGYIEEFGYSKLESSGELKALNGMLLTWEGKAGSVVSAKAHLEKSESYLIFWPINDKMFQLDPIIAFFEHNHTSSLQKIIRGDRVIVRGTLEINSEAPKIVLRKAFIINHFNQ